MKEIDNIIKSRYNNYSGVLFSNLKKAHQILRKQNGDQWFLSFLEDLEKTNPRPKDISYYSNDYKSKLP